MIKKNKTKLGIESVAFFALFLVYLTNNIAHGSTLSNKDRVKFINHANEQNIDTINIEIAKFTSIKKDIDKRIESLNKILKEKQKKK